MMESTLRIPIGSPEDLDSAVEYCIRTHLGPSTYISKKSVGDTERALYEIGNSYLEIISDAETTNRPTLIKKRIDNIFSVDIVKEKDRYAVLLPSIDTISKATLMRINERAAKSETALIETAHDRFIKIPMVSIALSPIFQILEAVDSEETISAADIHHRKGSAKAQKYLDFLSQIDFLKRENGHFVKGDMFKRYSKSTGDELYNIIAARVLEAGFEYLQGYFHLTMLTPYMRLSNSYYYPSGEFGNRLKMDAILLRDYEKRLYGRFRNINQLRAQVGQMRRAKIFAKDRKYILGDSELFANYCKAIKASCTA